MAWMIGELACSGGGCDEDGLSLVMLMRVSRPRPRRPAVLWPWEMVRK